MVIFRTASTAIAAATSLSACFLLWASQPSHIHESASRALNINLSSVTSFSWSGALSSTFAYGEGDEEEPQLSTYNQTFPDYLSKYPKDDLIWLTLADQFFSRTCTRHLQSFINNLQPYSSPLDGKKTRRHRLITLCIDPGCMETCRERNWECYGEYELSRPSIIFPATWPKLAGLIDILETGRDAIFVDSDVFFRSNPFEQMEPLGKYEWQIQDEAIGGNVNTGFFHIMPTPNTIAHWKGVLAMDMVEVSRDQHNTNTLLGTAEIRPIEGASEGPADLSEFVSKNNISVKVIPTSTVYSFHLSFSWPRLHPSDAVAWHGTCLDNSPLKYLLPREVGFWQDIDDYYSSPPALLNLPYLTGTKEQLATQMRQFAGLAIQTNRSMIPPSFVTVQLEDSRTVTQSLFTIFPLDELVLDKKLPLLEAHYIEHALPYHLKDADMTTDLLADNTINVATYGGIEQLAEALSMPQWTSHKSITLMNWSAAQLAGNLLESLDDIRLCARLEEGPGCAQVCRKP